MTELHALMARNLKTLRAYRNLTQDGLAEAAGLSKNYIAEIETERKYPSPDAHVRLACALGVKPYQLLLEAGASSGVAVIGDVRELLVRELTEAVDR
ncbi:MAG: helix-turn-helix transcriptional regulator, partial [Spirochaetales bacterium]|nr:helix-turn-helix transcriptional regulator [Spirochaetales bacterium]